MEMSVVDRKDIPIVSRPRDTVIRGIVEKARDLASGEALCMECETWGKARSLSTNLRQYRLRVDGCEGLEIRQRGTSVFCWFEEKWK